MDFARKILGKYGWKDGDGLGKNNDGISKPLKATLKFDNAGFGADQASDFNNHWWERVFNDAADNILVDKDKRGESIKINLKDPDDDGVEISTKCYSVKKLKKAKAARLDASENGYDNFMQAATLTNKGGEIENPDRIEATDIDVSHVKVLTDEELFKACGGRTAHKGARHGLKLSGKLARLEQQEKELLTKMMAKQNNGTGECKEDKDKPPKLDSGTDMKKRKKKRKRHNDKDVESCENANEKMNITESLEHVNTTENKIDCEDKLENVKRKKNVKEIPTFEEAETQPAKKKKKSKHGNKTDSEEFTISEQSVHKKKKKSKKLSKD
ncbi:G patch domain-containing protein 4 [Haematobia irritans]|uniref:G patch domain-containing protein 4 n=1 Tax=Haematobia irritans TaxID=7368 RepID=UPI003F500088